jgi:hypothetical protein
MAKERLCAIRERILRCTTCGIGVLGEQCEVILMDSDQARSFIINNDLGYGVESQVYVGLQFNSEVVSVMGFNVNSRHGTNFSELTHYCSKGRVVGGASKILKNFMNMYPDHSIVSYSDNRYSDGGLYETLGFELESSDNVSYGYIRFGSDEVVNRFNFTKYKLTEMASYREDLSETQIMDLEGYFRVYDAGKKTWIKKPTLNP